MGNWSYSGDPRKSPLDEVRFLIGDTDEKKPWTLLDGEINYALSLYSSNPPVVGKNLLAAANCAESVLAKLKSVVSSKSVGDLHISYLNPQTLTMYQETAYRLRQRANLVGVPMYVGGQSVAEKLSTYSDPDRVQIAVKIDGMNDADPQNPESNNTTVP
jgi:hypothetical protein